MTPDELSADVQRPEQQTAPSEELENSGPAPDVVSSSVAAAAAVLSPAGRPRQLNAVKTGTRSAAVQTLLAPARSEIEQQAITDLGGDAEALPVTLKRLVTAYAETSLLRESLFLRMEGQPLTNKGKARAMFGAYLQLIDREHRLAQAIGLTRKPRRIETVTDLMERG